MAQKTTEKALSLNDVRVMIETENGDNETIGMIQTVEVTLTVNKETLWEAGGSGVAKDRVILKKEVAGTFERILINKTILIAMWPSFEEDPVPFDLKGIAKDSKGSDRDYIVKGCTIDGFPVSMDLESSTKQSISFTGLSFQWINP